MKRHFFSYLHSQQYGIMGALSAMSMVSGLLEFNSTIDSVVLAWQSVTSFIFDYTLGLFVLPFEIVVPGAIKDYFCLGAILSAGLYRGLKTHFTRYMSMYLGPYELARNRYVPVAFLAWPVILAYFANKYIRILIFRDDWGNNPRYYDDTFKFKEMMLPYVLGFVPWFLIFICLNYALWWV
jgi:hypothetical protein